jgi:carbon-monoxide dehydrogenase large subunit
MPHLATEFMVVGLPSPSYKQDLNRPALAGDEVVHVGQAVAIVVADDRYIAEDAAALVEVDYQPIAAVSDCRAALAPGAPKVHRKSPHNLLAEFDMAYGDVDAAFKKAAHVFRESLWQHRGGGHSIECRGAVAMHDALEDKLTLWSSTQMPHGAQRLLCDMLGRDENQVRVITPDVGGGFGPKLVFYPEDVVTALAAMLVKRPVKWIEDRLEHFVATTQERDQYWDVEVAVDRDARLLGIRGAIVHDHGAYTARGVNLPYNSAENVPLGYELPAYRMNVKVALTNKVPVTPVRGAGHPQGVFVMERLLDRVARELKLDRAEVRRRNLVPGGKMPYKTKLKARGGLTIELDSGDFPKCQQQALDRGGWDEFPARQAAARREGRHIGIGVANFVKGTGRGPFESVTVRIGPSGRVHVYSGAAAMGQSTKTMLAQVVAEQLGADIENITVTAGDTGAISMGLGGSNSRQTVMAGASAHAAASKVREKALKVASHTLEAAERDLEIEGREIRVKGSDLKLDLGRAARSIAGTAGYSLPAGMAPGLEATEHVVIDAMAYANGTAVVEVEVDIETGAVRIAKIVFVHDCGRILHPVIVEGQLMGGVAHGIGNALYEWMRYDDNGQPITSTLADYLLVTAPEMPPVELGHMESPTPLNPLGVKGVGECGVVPIAAAVASAIEDALSPYNVRVTRTPITPAEIVRLIAEAKR